MRRTQLFPCLALIAGLSIPHSTALCQAQQEDSKGQDVLVGYLSGLFLANIANASLSFGYTVNPQPWTIDFKVQGKATNGLSSLLSTGQLTPGAVLGLGVGYNLSHNANSLQTDAIQEGFESLVVKLHAQQEIEEKRAKNEEERKKIQTKYEAAVAVIQAKEAELLIAGKAPDQYKLGLLGSYESSLYNLFRPDTSFANQVTKYKFEAGSLGAYLTAFFTDFNTLSTLLVAIKRSNNIQDLTDKTVTSTQTFKDSSGTNTREIKKDVTVWTGSFETFTSVEISLGAMTQPDPASPVGISSFLKYSLWSNSKNDKFLEAGVGIHLLDPAKMLAPRIGLVVEYSGRRTNDNPDADFLKALSLNLLTSLSFTL